MFLFPLSLHLKKIHESQFTPVSLPALFSQYSISMCYFAPLARIAIFFSGNGVHFLSTTARMKRTHWLPTVHTSSSPLLPKGLHKLDTHALGRCKRQLSIEARKRKNLLVCFANFIYLPSHCYYWNRLGESIICILYSGDASIKWQ